MGIKIDGKTRTDPKFPTGFMDVVQIDKTGENFRIIYDVKGRFTVHRITATESKYRLCHTCIPLTDAPSDTPTPLSRFTTPSSWISPPATCAWSLVAGTLGESVPSCPGSVTLAPSTLCT